MRISARLAEAEARQLAEICAKTGQTVSEVVREALRRHFEVLCGRGSGSLRAILDAGLIGCGEADPDLSAGYKDVLRAALGGKPAGR